MVQLVVLVISVINGVVVRVNAVTAGRVVNAIHVVMMRKRRRIHVHVGLIHWNVIQRSVDVSVVGIVTYRIVCKLN